MDKEDIIRKWLNHELTPAEEKEFTLSSEYAEFKRLDLALKKYKAPAYSSEVEVQNIPSRRSVKNLSSFSSRLFYRIAASLIFISLVGSIIYFSLADHVKTIQSVDKMSFNLPDRTKVELNNGSTITYDEENWELNRLINLKGEAFFDVVKGSAFTVETGNGKVTVLGTEFNVYSREKYFEVQCFEGKVKVSHGNNEYFLNAGDVFQNYFENDSLNLTVPLKEKPSWLKDKSSFKNAPLDLVINELGRQYNMNVEFNNIDSTKRFSGTFPHNNFELALKTIIVPMKLEYEVSAKTIKFKETEE